MREFSPSSLGLTGSLLIAHPNLLDPNFRRSILYISTHDEEEGAFGLILNRPTEKTITDLLDDSDLEALDNVPVFFGGPVANDQLTFASFEWDVSEKGIVCRTHLAIGEAREIAAEDPSAVRAFLGYAGWSKGQLEAEIAQKAWLVQKPDRDILDMEKCRNLWQTIMREQGPWFKLLAAAPDDPSKN